MTLALQRAFVGHEYSYHIPFRSCGLQSETTHALVDFAIQKTWGSLLLEVDEDQHKGCDPSCDVRRDMGIYASVAMGSGDRLRVLRFNPNGFYVGGTPGQVSKQERLQRLIALIQQLDEDPWPDLPLARMFLYYDVDGPDAKLPSVAKLWQSEEARAISFVVK
jgi:hypothetical protein